MPHHKRQVCKNGHTITQYLDRYPDQDQNYCNCGEETISECPSEDCNADIRGTYYVGKSTSLGDKTELMDHCPECGEKYPWAGSTDKEEGTEGEEGPLERLNRIASRFEQATLPLRNTRRRGKDGIDIEDEYDVQDFLEMMLKTVFDDVRDEEPTPQNAGGSSNIDFLLPTHNIAIEVKETSGLRSNEVRNQLSEDIDNYSEHKDAEHLFCFVYDPANVISNPIGFTEDLERESGEMSVKVVIRPNLF